MQTLVDTSVVVRYLVGDPPQQAERAATILDREPDLGITALVIVETAYVLTSVYRIERATVVDHLIALVQKENIQPVDIAAPLLLEALMLCRPSRRTSFTDALVWAAARQHRVPRVATFDRRFPDDGLEIIS